MPVQLPGIPSAIATTLDHLTDELTRMAGQNFAGLILYGGVARGRYRPGRSDVNVVVLLHDASPTALTAIAPALQKAWRAAGVDPLLLTPAEIPQAAEVFPTKFLDIKNHHVVLAGADPFTQLEVPREQIRLRAEQELRNLLLRLRHGYIATGDDSVRLARILTRTARPLALELKALLQVAGKEIPAEDRTAALYEMAVAAFGLKREPLARLAELRETSRRGSELTTLYRDVLETIAQAAHVAVRMKEPPR